MCNVSIAREKVKNLTIKLEKDLYILRYSNSEFLELTDDIYIELKRLCDDNSCATLSFPLKKKDGKIYLNESNEDLFKVLHILAEDFSIVLDHMNVT